jgi:type IV pilus assembly protein PilB
MTLEDPVEYFIEGINQSQVRPEIGYTYAKGLRHVLRQDPDIIMVGEVRDSESAALVIHAALTGHLVLSTVHTTNALGVIPRLIDLGIAPFLIPPTLSLAVAQRLIRILCSECKKKVKPSPKIAELVFRELEDLPPQIKKTLPIKKPLTLYQPKGCKKCRQTGYLGRTGVFEVLEMTDNLAQVILKEPSEAKIFEVAKKEGYLTMKQDGIIKALEGITSVEEVLRVAEEK